MGKNGVLQLQELSAIAAACRSNWEQPGSDGELQELLLTYCTTHCMSLTAESANTGAKPQLGWTSDAHNLGFGVWADANVGFILEWIYCSSICCFH